MREIKFRAWDKKHKLMQALSNIFKPMSEDMQTYINHDEGICHLFIGHGAFVGIEHPSDIVLMQYTGLLDSKGKEIYEGDILTTNNKDAVNWKCIFEKGSFLFSRIGYENEGGYGWRGDLYVIGNIYENPNLLSQDK